MAFIVSACPNKIIFMKAIILTAATMMLLQLTGCSQHNNKSIRRPAAKHVGGPCEGCEAIYESSVPFEQLKSTDSLPDFNEPGPRISISGIVYKRDGKTPARDVVIYVYHTDQTGHYTPGKDAKGWEKRNGRIRGWMKTDKNGFYQFYTLRPASYPNSNIPQHIHVIVKESDKNEYYIDEYLFDDDKFLTETERNKQEKRGGSGIIKLVSQSNGILHGTRHIILGMNIPGYPL
jgi:protocatechuate 3,4-dioxygenase, beta subunit